ncbi:RNA polymerase sigma-70 factor, ECF subfamily [Paenibacillus algorifonticola]|uniref:RNA polymerase sigma-70 factor, ECF subfamily n=1 Tax=Paenibacillus algorifonticola TaxID=684063 RepID=A0A1I2C5I9_9BACL|nr:sigma-70 family RNA polymerase sigma factor [Paenibacillus algorifonticola]SFE63554.1 RNA polymerase sigma-70 factor, ECF subfamily [Paenibacillus algorifonticola]
MADTQVLWQVAKWYADYKTLLSSLAYKLLGSRQEADDVVQDIFVTLQSAEPYPMRNVKAYLCKMTVNRCMNRLQSARHKREAYVGEWLPEPWSGEYGDGPLEQLARRETISYAILVMLEHLSPLERAVFVLREGYGYGYDELAELVGKSEANCRKILSRAKQALELYRQLPESQVEEQELTVDASALEPFVAAFEQADIGKLLALMRQDAVLYTDGGGKVTAARRPIISARRAVLLLRRMSTHSLHGTSISVSIMNGQPALVFRRERAVQAVMCLEWVQTEVGSRIKRIYTMYNPDKLSFI